MAKSESVAKKTVMVVDDHPILRRGIVQLINDDPGLKVVGESEDVAGAMKILEAGAPDIAVIDISLKDGNGIDLVRTITERWSQMPVLVFSMHDEAFYAERVLRAGARGYVTKGEPATRVIEGLHKVLGGQVFVSEKIAAKMLHRVVGGQRQPEGFPIDSLSDREFEIFSLIGEGLQTREVADQLGLSIKTVESHRENIKRKLNIDNATELLQRAIHWVRFERGH
jgi:DNA-binding NarL/FixJ family response regulator